MANDLDLSALALAVKSFERGVAVFESREKEDAPDDEKELLRAGIIQTLEYTYELCWKFMKRWLDANLGPHETSGINRREFYRICAENSLIDDVDEWMDFHQARNLTTHTYNEEMAVGMPAVARRFLPYAKDCLKRLEERL
jgi:nucleotidyltransferase substrate binding protein (TIGR01987 family)